MKRPTKAVHSARFAATFFALAVILAAALMVAATPALAAETAAAEAEYELRLCGALFQGENPVQDGPMLLLNLRRSGDRWERVWGVAGSFNRSVHWGRVTEGKVAADALLLSLAMNIIRDQYVPGGRATYAVELKRAAGGSFEGTFTGTFKGQAVKGRAEATVLPRRTPLKPDFVPAKPGEHPRVLFRAGDLPALRKKAETDLGRAAIAKMTDGIGLGIRYQLTGDRKYADEARAFVERRMAGDGAEEPTLDSRHGTLKFGWRYEQVGVTYDLCYDAWPADFRKKVEDYIVLWTYRLFYSKSFYNGETQWDHGAGESGNMYHGAAMAALALWGEKGPAPAKPADPFAGREAAPGIPPAAGYTPGKGVPVGRLDASRMPDEWIYIGGFLPKAGEDPLAALGGPSKARPEVGTEVKFADRSETFRPLSHEQKKGRYNDAIDVTNAIGRVMNSTSYFYTVIENDQPRWVRLVTGHGGVTVYVSGVALKDGDVARIEKGVHPLMVAIAIGETNPWGVIHMQPRFLEQTEEQAKARIAEIRADYDEQLKDWEFDTEQWNRTGGQSVDFLRAFELTRRSMFMHVREAFGTGGAQGDIAGNSYGTALGPGRYALAYRGMFGADLSPYADITHVLPWKVFAHVYPTSGEPAAQDISGPTEIKGDYFANLFPLVPDEWKPAILWAWNREVDVTGKDSAAQAVSAKGHPSTPVYAFLNYPLEMEPKPPQGVMPLAWEAPDFGYYGFRSAWASQDDFVVQFFARAHVIHGYNVPNAGTFRVMGLGHVWARGLPALRLHNQRAFENVVVLPENEINDTAQGRVVYTKTERDGSGVVTVDLGDVYAQINEGTDRTGKTVKQALYERYGNARRPGALKDIGIKGIRSFAVDYSARSGAPCLIAVVDRISGGKSKMWTWHLDEKTDPKPAKIDGGAFTLALPDGTALCGTFAVPDKPQIRIDQRGVTFEKTYNRGKGEFQDPGIFVTGSDPTAGDFFVVLTIQRGAPPPAKVEGAGLAAKVTVGKRTVAFDGQKIVFGE